MKRKRKMIDECWEQLLELDKNFIKFTKNNYLYPTLKKQLAAVKQNGYRIQFINNPSEEVQLAAVKQNGNSIRFINKSYNPSEEVQLAAVKQSGDSILFNNPSDKIKAQYIKGCNPEVIRLLQDPGFDLD